MCAGLGLQREARLLMCLQPPAGVFQQSRSCLTFSFFFLFLNFFFHLS